MNDDHEIVGVRSSKQLMEDIPNKIVTHLGIVADVNLLNEEGRDYVEIIVEPSNMPISYHGHYHYRNGSTKQELRGVALQQFILKKLNVSWDATPCMSATIEDIDKAAVEFFVKRAVKEGRIPEDCLEETTEQTLRRLHLVTADGQMTMAAMLLFGKDIEQWCATAIFRIGRFGVDESDMIMNDDISCPLILMPSRIMEILRSRYLVSPIHYEGMQRKEPLEIPSEALREMLCNSLVHKDYQSTYIQMKVWNDHLTIWNPGTLPLDYSIETLMTEHESYPRNKLIARVFYLAGYIEAWGRGYAKIRENFERAKLEMPEFSIVRNGVMARVKREFFASMQISSESGGEIGDEISGEILLTDRQRVVINLIASNHNETAAHMARLLGCGQRSVERDISFLRKNGFIGKESNNRSPWIILKKQ